MNDTPQQPDEWAKVEIFGHRQHVGRIAEIERFGTKMLRIDEPTADPEVFTTHFYGGGSVFSISTTIGPTDAGPPSHAAGRLGRSLRAALVEALAGPVAVPRAVQSRLPLVGLRALREDVR